jgi:hypothetical protein
MAVLVVTFMSLVLVSVVCSFERSKLANLRQVNL